MSKAFDKFLEELNAPVPQTKPENELLQVANSAGGFSFEVTPQARLERFLILGTDGGTYYISEQDLTKQNVDWLIKSIQLAGDGGLSILQTVVDISVNGRAYRNSAAIFTLALLFKHAPPVLKQALKYMLPKVCRTSTHLFEFAGYIDAMNGWGRAKRDAVAAWYEARTADELAYQAVKYRQRNGWTHRDLFRLSHPKNIDRQVGNFILGKGQELTVPQIDLIDGFNSMQSASNVSEVVRNLDNHPNLPWETIPTQFLKEPEVWKKLFFNGQLKGQALVRNVTRMARIGAFDDMMFARAVADMLTDEEMIKRSRLHPINYLNALVVYTEGQVDRNGMSFLFAPRRMDWNTTPAIIDALNAGFYTAFKYIEPAGKRTLIALDVSASMSGAALGIDLSCAQVSAAMSMTIARTEPFSQVMGFATEFRDLGIAPSMSLTDVMTKVRSSNFGGTDCSLPITWALNRNVEVDTFLVITDNETWAGRVHPHVALLNYRNKMGIDARLVVAGVASNGFTIADPRDRGMLDIVGADSNMPRIISDFSAGRI